MSIFSKWFKKKNRVETEYYAPYKLEPAVESESASEASVEQIVEEYKTNENSISSANEVDFKEVKIPWGTPRAEMTDIQREAARAYDRKKYAERKQAAFELDVDGCMPV